VQGHGEGGIVTSMGLDGFANPRLLWQSSIPTSSGGKRKPTTIVAIKANAKDGTPIPEAKQRKAAGPNPIIAGRGSAQRFYKRPVLRSKGATTPDRGEPLRQLQTGKVWWQSKARTKAGKQQAPFEISPLGDEQVTAIEFELWLRKHYPSPVERFLYLVREHDAVVVVNHSGGKDSQAMYLHLTRGLGVPHKQIKIVHADLPGADWPGTLDHIKQTTDTDVKVVRAKFADGAVKELYDYVLKRGKFPSAQQRYCTSDLKTSPINSWIRQTMCELNGLPRACEIPKDGRRIIVSAMGMRAGESPDRAGLAEWELNVGQSLAGRIWFEYLPIHGWKTSAVFDSIKRYGQAPFWIYGQTPADCRRLIDAGAVDTKGRCVPMQRMSCVFCIMSSLSDIGVASKVGPQEIAERICDAEETTGHTFVHGKSFRELRAKGEEKMRTGEIRKRLDILITARKRKGPCK
jgi:3'-phosphoadenosine 5'-phosphosulfate sulfotransferase (PAPS reductase)/FAD synthetase